MSIVYQCRHCHQKVGQLDEKHLAQLQSSLNEMSRSEQEEIIQYGNDGAMHLLIICENCEESLEEHPQYHELDFFIQ